MLLQGYRVVELGVWVAAPGAGGMLADWGADVIKVEPAAGDPLRTIYASYAGMDQTSSPPFDLDNRGKRSVVVDLGEPEGREILGRLLDTADVFLTNLRPAALERLGLDPDATMAKRPRLVYASVTGYGLDGPERDRAAYDVGAFWARTGVAWSLRPPGEEPPGIRGGFGDHYTATAAVAGICAALLDRERTGKGQLVATSLLRAGVYSLGWDLSTRLHFGKLASTPARTNVMNPLVNSYRAGDGRWFWLLGLEADRHWPRLVAALDDERVADERFAGARDRRSAAPEVVGLLDEVFATRTLEEWAERFDASDVWWAPVQSPDEVLVDPQIIAAGGFVEVPTADGGTATGIATPVTFGAANVGPAGPPPLLGEHTAEVLAELGFGPQ